MCAKIKIDDVMRNCLVLFITFIFMSGYAQQKQFEIKWTGHKKLENEFGKIEVPAFEAKHFNYDHINGLVYFNQWEANGGNIDENSARLANVTYETISSADLKNLNPNLIPNSPKLKVYNTNARWEQSYYMELSPIVNDKGVFKKITSFTLEYNVALGRNAVFNSNQSACS
jgi:hypothetical protein